jgi:hypothetical protein
MASKISPTDNGVQMVPMATPYEPQKVGYGAPNSAFGGHAALQTMAVGTTQI